jgi:hypothetical protein
MRIAFMLVMVGVNACVGVKPYEKEYLLDPLMDDASLQSLNSDFRGNCVAPYERLSVNGAGGGATSCPTCGG